MGKKLIYSYRKKDAPGKIKNKTLKIPLSFLTIFMMTRDVSVTTSPKVAYTPSSPLKRTYHLLLVCQPPQDPQ